VTLEFSNSLDMMLTNLSEFLNFKIKRIQSQNDLDSQTDWTNNLPRGVRCWIDNTQNSDSTPSKPLSDVKLGLSDKIIRDEVKIIPRKRKMIKALLSEIKTNRPKIETHRVFVVTYLQQMEYNRSPSLEKADVMERKRAIYDNLDVYLRNHFYSHLSRS
jgi:hypothetical protein